MQITIDIPTYNPNNGIKLNWQDNFEIVTKSEAGDIIITANKAGLISLATHLLTLAQDEVPSGCHIHYDETNSLENGSVELVIQKK